MLELAVYALVLALVAFALVPLTLHGVGARLPREHVARASVRVEASAEAVYARIAAVAEHPRWRRRVARMQALGTSEPSVPGAEPRARFRQRGRDGTLDLEVEEARPPSRFVLRTARAERAIFTGTWTFEVAPDDGRARVTLVERGEIASPIARVFARYLLGEATNVERTLADLRASFAPK